MKRSAAWTALVIFSLIAVVQLFYHEIWRDEWQAWLIARDSNSLSELFHNLRYEGHPALWHVLLYGFTKITHHPWPMQAFAVAVSIGSAYLILFRSPFKPWQRVLLVLGYFMIYEYTVIARPYGLSLFLVLLFCTVQRQTHTSFWYRIGILVFLSQTHFYGTVIAVALCVWMVWPARKYYLKKHFIGGVVVMLAAVALAVWQMIPPPDSGILESNNLHFDRELLFNNGGLLWKALVPLPMFKYGWWNTNVVNYLPGYEYWWSVLSLFLFAGCMVALSKSKRSMGFFFTVLAVLMAFGYLKFTGFTRHHGMVYVAFLAAWWLSRTQPCELTGRWVVWRKQIAKPFLGFVLVAQVVAGAIMVVQGIRTPLSGAKEAAEVLRENGYHKTDYTYYVERDYIGAPLAGYLDTTVFYIRIKEHGSFLKWNTARKQPVPYVEAAQYVKNTLDFRKGSFVLLLDQPLPEHAMQGLKQLSAITDPLEKGEQYYIYVKH